MKSTQQGVKSHKSSTNADGIFLKKHHIPFA